MWQRDSMEEYGIRGKKDKRTNLGWIDGKVLGYWWREAGTLVVGFVVGNMNETITKSVVNHGTQK